MSVETIFTEREWAMLRGRVDMSPRQEQIAHCIIQGMGDRQIAETVGIKVPTVRTHMARLFDKLEVGDRVELILYFMHEFRSEWCPKPQPKPSPYEAVTSEAH